MPRSFKIIVPAEVVEDAAILRDFCQKLGEQAIAVCEAVARYAEYPIQLDCGITVIINERFLSVCPVCGAGTKEGWGTGKYRMYDGEGPEQMKYRCPNCRNTWVSFEAHPGFD